MIMKQSEIVSIPFIFDFVLQNFLSILNTIITSETRNLYWEYEKVDNFIGIGITLNITSKTPLIQFVIAVRILKLHATTFFTVHSIIIKDYLF